MVERPPSIVPLSTGLPPSPALFGGKAKGLFTLSQGGFPVPPGFAVLPEAERADLDPRWPEIPHDGSWIVRSSALAEDSAGNSFAGLFESIGDLKREQVWDAVGKVRASSKNERVRAYQESRNLPLDSSPIPVVIQQEIKAQVSGVAFTLNPSTGKDFEVLIEACRGMGEQLVSGHITPYQWIFDRRDLAFLEERPGNPDTSPPLHRSQIQELVALLLRIQAYFGAPQDIEWVWDGQEFFIVQSRPITRFQERMDMGEWTSADFRDGGVSSSVCSPFMYSLYEDAVEHSMTAYFRGIRLLRSRPKWMTYQYGRAYWNLGAVKDCLKRVPGYNEEEFDKDLGIEKEYGDGPWKTETTLATILPVIPTAIMLETEFIAHRLRIRRFTRRFPAQKARLLKLLGSSRECAEQAAYGLKKAIRELQGPTERTYFRAIYNSTNLQGEFKKLLDGYAAKMDPKPGHLPLVTGLGDIAHFECERDLHTLYTCPAEELEAEFETFFKRHGYRGTRELDITVPRWSEDTSFIRDQVKRVRGGPDPIHPDEVLGKQQKIYEKELDRVLTRLPSLDALVFRARLFQARDYLVAREKMRDCSTQAYAVVRDFALELGKRLVHRGLMKSPSEVFLLTFQEAIAWGQNPEEIENSEEVLAARQRDMDGFRSFKAPHEFGIGQKPKASRADPDSLTGIPCSPGQVTAKAYLAHTVEDAAKAPKGSILIAPFTDPGWTPVFSRLAAVVTEVGGLLSHAAVLSREYGIPAVLAVDGALEEFKTGEEVLVDGHHGYVQRVKKEKVEDEERSEEGAGG